MEPAYDLDSDTTVFAARYARRTAVASLVCTECFERVTFVRAGAGRQAHFRHGVPRSQAHAPCSLRALDEGAHTTAYTQTAETHFGGLGAARQVSIVDALARHIPLLLSDGTLDGDSRRLAWTLRHHPDPLLACATREGWADDLGALLEAGRKLPTRRHTTLLRHLLTPDNAMDPRPGSPFLTVLAAGWALARVHGCARLKRLHPQGERRLDAWFRHGPDNPSHGAEFGLMTALGLTRACAGTQARLLRQLTGEGVLRLLTHLDIDRLLIDPAGVRAGLAWVYLARRTFDDARAEAAPVFKIGRTRRPPAARMREHGAGLPDGDYAIVDMELVQDPVAVESRLRAAIQPHRAGLGGAEFFRARPVEAAHLFRGALQTEDIAAPAAPPVETPAPAPRPPAAPASATPRQFSSQGIRVPLKTLNVPKDHRQNVTSGVDRAVRRRFARNAGQRVADVPQGNKDEAAAATLRVGDARRRVVERAVARWMAKNVSPVDPERLRRLARRTDVHARLPWEMLLLYPSPKKLAAWAARCVPRDTPQTLPASRSKARLG